MPATTPPRTECVSPAELCRATCEKQQQKTPLVFCVPFSDSSWRQHFRFIFFSTRRQLGYFRKWQDNLFLFFCGHDNYHDDCWFLERFSVRAFIMLRTIDAYWGKFFAKSSGKTKKEKRKGESKKKKKRKNVDHLIGHPSSRLKRDAFSDFFGKAAQDSGFHSESGRKFQCRGDL